MTVQTTHPAQGLETPEFQRLLDACHAVSTEAFDLGDLNEIISGRLPKITAALKDAFRFMTTWDYSRPEVVNAMSVNGVLRKYQYTDMDSVMVTKPLGFTGNLHDYVSELKNQQLGCLTGLVDHVLKPAQARFAHYLNHPEDLVQRHLEPTPVWSKDVLAACINAERKWVVEGNRDTDGVFTELYHSNRQCVDAMVTINDINKERWNKANPKTVAKETDLLVKLADRVFKSMPTSPTVSKAVLTTLATELELAGRWVEWYSVLTTRIINTTTALKYTETKVIDSL